MNIFWVVLGIFCVWFTVRDLVKVIKNKELKKSSVILYISVTLSFFVIAGINDIYNLVK